MKCTRTELKNNIGKLFKATYRGPVFITDYGQDGHALLTIEDYNELLERIQQLEQCCKENNLPMTECANTQSKD